MAITINIIEQSISNNTLNLSYKNLSPEDAVTICIYLNRHPEIRSLDVSWNQIGDEGARVLAANTTLTTLNVRANLIGDEGAKALAKNTSLKSLNVLCNRIGDEGAIALATNTSLTSLYVGSNNIGYIGARALAKNTSLTSLNVSNQTGNKPDIGMMVLSGFMAAAGIAVIALAVTVFWVPAVSVAVPGFLLACNGIALIVGSVGIFASNAMKFSTEEPKTTPNLAGAAI